MGRRWAPTGWPTLFFESTSAAASGGQGLSGFLLLRTLQEELLAGAWDAGELLPSSLLTLVTDPSPLWARTLPRSGLASPPVSLTSTSELLAGILALGLLRLRPGIALASDCPLIRGRGLVCPTCVWHLHTWGGPRA